MSAHAKSPVSIEIDPRPLARSGLAPRRDHASIGPWETLGEFGAFTILKRLPPGRVGDRWLARRRVDLTPHIIHRLAPGISPSIDAFSTAVRTLRRLGAPHVLGPEAAGVAGGGRPWVATRHVGGREGVRTLRALLKEKGGVMPALEAARVVEQLAEALAAAERKGVTHGAFGLDDVVVDRRGSVALELFGLERLISGRAGSAEDARAQVGSLARVARAIAGVNGNIDGPRFSARWRVWIAAAEGDGAGAFVGGAEALKALPRDARMMESRVAATARRWGRVAEARIRRGK